ncbi:MocR-like pyridoxine biosynthesis transcription factor PdxR [Kiloniella sp. b19]|uniref:MocR-like pyridoxine biosynthesis transcription factor PdxR n=1 Tax=Kiloniella sp. GXU_MW_B19 TaxID=3141326 RepID=UPI0031E17DDE
MQKASTKTNPAAGLFVPLISIDRSLSIGIRDQLQSEISRLIAEGILSPGTKLPSCRRLARDLGIAINSVLGAYARLCEDRLIISRPKSGFFVSEELSEFSQTPPERSPAPRNSSILERITKRRLPSQSTYILRPPDWSKYQYPFVCNQIDINRFPLGAWRECTRMAMNKRDLDIWSGDNHYWDAQEILDQLCMRILPRRGIAAAPENILITLGTQHALYLVGTLMQGQGRVVAMEDPGYADARNMFEQLFDEVRFIPVDDDGMIVDDRLKGCDLVYVTPNHQYPTTAILSAERRSRLIRMAEDEDFLIIEDDYDSDLDFRSMITSPLYKDSRNGRVIYTSSLSKSLAPGLRIGYLVAQEELVREARALRGLMIRHPPLVMQHTAALFLRFGHHEALCSRLHKAFRRRYEIAADILQRDFRDFTIKGRAGGTNFLLRDETRMRHSADIVSAARERGVIVEATSPCYFTTDWGDYAFRIGLSAVSTKQIAPGLAALRQAIDTV